MNLHQIWMLYWWGIYIVQERFVADVAPFISETDGSSMTNTGSYLQC